VLDCASLGGASPGTALWSTTLPGSPDPAWIELAVGSAGRSFVSVAHRPDGGGDLTMTVDLHQIAGNGADLGPVASLSHPSQIIFQPELAVYGERHWVLGTRFYTWGGFGSVQQYVTSDNGSLTELGLQNSMFPQPYSYLRGAGNAAGDTFFISLGTGKPSHVARLDATGTTVFDVMIPEWLGLSDARPDETGALYLVGQHQGTLDLGCGPIAVTSGYLAKLGPTGQCVWSKPAGISAMPVPTSGGAYLVGNFSGSFDIGCGAMTTTASPSAYVARVDASGACLWSKAIGAPGPDYRVLPSGDLVFSVAFHEPIDGSTACGPIPSDGTPRSLFAKLAAADGACAWSKVYSEPHVVPGAFPSGDVQLVVPSFTAPIDLGAGPVSPAGTADFAVARLDGATGAHVWSRTFGSAGATVTGYAEPDVAGGVLFHGTVQGTVDLGAGPVSSATPQACTANADCLTSSQSCSIDADCTTPCVNGTCLATKAAPFLLKLDASGAYRWQRLAGAAALDGCGAAVHVSRCSTCGPNSGPGYVVERVAP
jgi:hypothetical protein